MQGHRRMYHLISKAALVWAEVENVRKKSNLRPLYMEKQQPPNKPYLLESWVKREFGPKCHSDPLTVISPPKHSMASWLASKGLTSASLNSNLDMQPHDASHNMSLESVIQLSKDDLWKPPDHGILSHTHTRTYTHTHTHMDHTLL